MKSNGQVLKDRH
jgi:hypothetical protein